MSDNSSITAIVHTTPEQVDVIGDLSDTTVERGEWSEEGGFVAYDEGPIIIDAIKKQLKCSGPRWEDLSHKEQRDLVFIAASSPRWRHLGEIYDYRAQEVFAENPILWARFAPAA